jgi:hypothetical protein
MASALSLVVMATDAGAAGGDTDLTDSLNTAAAIAGVGLIAAGVGFTAVDVVLMGRGQCLPTGWSIVEIALAAPIAVIATGYSFQARTNELPITIPLALWTAALTTHGIISLANGDGDPGGKIAQRRSSWALTPTTGELAGHQFGGLTAVGTF